MKFNSRNISVIALILCSNILLAQPNPDDIPEDPLPPGPIDQYVVWLLLFAVAFAFARYRKSIQTK